MNEIVVSKSLDRREWRSFIAVATSKEVVILSLNHSTAGSGGHDNGGGKHDRGNRKSL